MLRIPRFVTVDAAPAPGDTSLRALHHIIQAAFGWEDCHLHEFRIDDARYGQPDVAGIVQGAFGSAKQIVDDRVTQLDGLLGVDQLFTYEYDFGDSWEHEITVEAVEERAAAMPAAEVIDGARACPPEDVGGSWRYNDIVAALTSDPQGEEAADFIEWMGASFDPELFDLREANAAVGQLARKGRGAK